MQNLFLFLEMAHKTKTTLTRAVCEKKQVSLCQKREGGERKNGEENE